MKKIFLPIIVPVLLVTLVFAQNPAPSSDTDQASIKGCLGGSDGNYTVAQDGTTQIFTVTSSTVDLKAHLGHNVELIGQKANASDNNVTVTGLNMISDHCAAAAASTVVVADPTPTPAASAAVVADPAPAPAASTAVVADPAPAPAASTAVVADPAPAPSTSAAAMPDPTPAASTEALPETASSLPLLGLLGLGFLAAGTLTRRSRRINS
jgi:hypothetical protein